MFSIITDQEKMRNIINIDANIIAASMYFWSVSLVDQKPISHFFGQPIFFGQPKTIFSCFWSTNFFLVNQKNEKLTGQLVDQRHWPKVHGRRSCKRSFCKFFNTFYLQVNSLAFTFSQSYLKVTWRFELIGSWISGASKLVLNCDNTLFFQSSQLILQSFSKLHPL